MRNYSVSIRKMNPVNEPRTKPKKRKCEPRSTLSNSTVASKDHVAVTSNEEKVSFISTIENLMVIVELIS